MEIRCSYDECSANPFSKCFCSDEPQIFCKDHMLDHIEIVNKLHRMEKIKILSQEEIKINRIAAFEGLYNSFKSIKSNLIQKIEALLQLKLNKFFEMIGSFILEIDEILNYLENNQNQKFLENFHSTYEETLSKFEKHTNEIANKFNSIEEVAILNTENSWRFQIGKEENDSDYGKLTLEIKPLKLDQLYAYAILRFLDHFDANNLINSFFNSTNFCDKENILKYVVKELTENHKTLLYSIVLMTRGNKYLAQSGSNSMSILVKAKYRFDRADLSTIHIPNANLSYGIFYKTNFSGSDLSNCNILCTQFLDIYLDEAIFPIYNTSNEMPPSKIQSIEISHSESWIAVCQNDRITIYDTYNSKKKKNYMKTTLNTTFKQFHDHMMTNRDGTIFIWLWEDSSKFKTHCNKIKPAQSSLAKVLWAPNDYRIVWWSSNGILKIWNEITKNNIFEDRDALITCLAWSKSGDRIAYYCESGIIWTWDSVTKQQNSIYECNNVHLLEWIYGEDYLVFVENKLFINTLEISTETKKSFPNWNEQPITALKWMDSQSLLVVGDIDGSITIWNIAPYNEGDCFLMECSIELFIYAHSSDILCLSWSNKNNLLVSGSADGTFKVWNIRRLNLIDGEIEGTDETHSLLSNKSDFENFNLVEELKWCSEAPHFIYAKSKSSYFINLS